MFVLNLAHFFTRLYGRGKQGGKFKIKINLNSVESFLYCLCSRKNFEPATRSRCRFKNCTGQPITENLGAEYSLHIKDTASKRILPVPRSRLEGKKVQKPGKRTVSLFSKPKVRTKRYLTNAIKLILNRKSYRNQKLF